MAELSFHLVNVRHGVGDDHSDEFSKTLPQPEYNYPCRAFIFLQLGAQFCKAGLLIAGKLGLTGLEYCLHSRATVFFPQPFHGCA